MRTAAEIGAVKIEAQLPLEQGARWADIMRSRLALAARLKLEKQFVGSLYELIHVEALSIQARLAAKATGKAPQAERTREKMPKARRKREAK
jgi:chorismate mutase